MLLSQALGAKFQRRPIEGKEARAAYSDLLDRCFDLPVGCRFLDDFPIWDPKWHVPGVSRIGYFKDQMLVSCTGVRISQIKGIQGREIKIALVGGVSTHPQWRGLGLASRGIREATDWAQKQGAAGVFLWSSEVPFYQKLGFDLWGEQIRLPLQRLLVSFGELNRAPPKSAPVLSDVNVGWDPRLFSLLMNREQGLLLKESDRIWIEAHKNVTWFWMNDSLAGGGTEPVAYAALGRGIDLVGVVHEWGGRLESLIKILERIRNLEPAATLLGHEQLFKKFGNLPDLGDRESLCLVKSLDSYLIKQLPLPMWIWGLDAV